MPRDLRRLLDDTAVVPSRQVDAAAVIRRGRRMQRNRQAAGVGLVAAVLLVAVAVVTRFQIRPDNGIIFQPQPTPSAPSSEKQPDPDSETTSDDYGPRFRASGLTHKVTRWELWDAPRQEVPARLPPHGLGVAVGSRVVLVGMDGDVHGHVMGRFDAASFYGGLDRTRQGPTNLLPVRSHDGNPYWLDPSTGRHVGGVLRRSTVVERQDHLHRACPRRGCGATRPRSRGGRVPVARQLVVVRVAGPSTRHLAALHGRQLRAAVLRQ